jgi:hypothetical protein
MWAESEDTQMRSARTQRLQSQQVKIQRPKNFCLEHYEEDLCSAEPLSGILLPQEDISFRFSVYVMSERRVIVCVAWLLQLCASLMKEQNSGTTAERRNCKAEYHVCCSIQDFKTYDYVSVCPVILSI